MTDIFIVISVIVIVGLAIFHFSSWAMEDFDNNNDDGQY
jgi:hypothetical protein